MERKDIDIAYKILKSSKNYRTNLRQNESAMPFN